MTLDEFVAKYDGRGIDFDGAYGTQCVDLYRQYVKEVLEFPQSPPVEGAKDIWNTYLPEYYQRIENTPYGVPEKGDIIIFGDTIGRYGHVSIFLEGTVSKFISFDQNYPSGSLCHKQGHTYNAVLGWLRPIKKDKMDTPDWFKQLLQEVGLSLDREGEFRSFWQKAIEYDDKVEELTQKVITANETLSDKAQEIAVLMEDISGKAGRIQELEEQLGKARSERDKAIGDKVKLESQVEALESNLEKAQSKIDRMERENELLAYSWWERFISLFQKGGDR